ncbi:MAG: MIP/aquaporin family protein [Acidobacteriota bacterium]
MPLAETRLEGNPAAPARESGALARALAGHWPEYLMEAAELGLFMVSACLVTVLLEHPDSPARQALPDAFLRRLLTGLAMGATAVAIVFSPLGKRSGAHFNPSVTLAFWRLGKVAGPDAFFYGLSQFGGAVAGVAVAGALAGPRIAHPSVRYAATEPGPGGSAAAFAAEAAISFLLMSVVLRVSNHARLARWTGVFAGSLVALFIAFEAPVSGMSMNPARTFGSAAWAGAFHPLWIYLTAPPLGMLAAAEVYRRSAGARAVHCAKLHHENRERCIFRCDYASLEAARAGRKE